MYVSFKLGIKGAKTIQARSSMSITKPVTFAATVGMSGKMVTPFLIIKDQPCGCIAMCEFEILATGVAHSICMVLYPLRL